MKYKVFVSGYICLVLAFIAVNELGPELSGVLKTGITAVFLLAAFWGRHILKDRH